MPEPRRIGLLGGTFNPVHCGHTMLAQYIAEFGGLDEVWLLLAGLNPLKADAGSTGAASDADRLAMLRTACAPIPHVEASDFELSLPRPSYTCLTLAELRRRMPGCEFTLLIGADNWAIFDRWRDWRDIVSRHRIIVYPRPGYEVDPAGMPPTVTYLDDAPVLEVSSTAIRDAIASGHCMNQFVPAGVYDYIEKHQLYGYNKTDAEP